MITSPAPSITSSTNAGAKSEAYRRRLSARQQNGVESVPRFHSPETTHAIMARTLYSYSADLCTAKLFAQRGGVSHPIGSVSSPIRKEPMRIASRQF